MKRLLLLFFLLAANIQGAPCPFTGTHGTSGIYTCPDGTLATIQGAVDELAIQAGDTIKIPATGGPWNWTDTLRVGNGTKPGGGTRTPMNIKIIGDQGNITTGTGIINNGVLIGNTMPVITGTSLPSFISYKCEDGSGKTAEIGNLVLNGSTSSLDNYKIEVNGVTTVKASAPYGGIRIHDVAFMFPYYEVADTVVSGASISGNTITATGHGLTSADNGRVVFGPNIPIYDTISSVPTANTIQLATAATAPGSGPVTVAGKLPPNHNGTKNPDWLSFDGWTEGVVDHCLVDVNIRRTTTKIGEGNFSTSPEWSVGTPNGNGCCGDYAKFYPGDLGGTYHGMYYEDNIFHSGAGGITDTNGGTTNGGGIEFFRHNTTWAAINVTHGTRESGSGQEGARFNESTQNHHLVSLKLYQDKQDINPTEVRDGEGIAYNNYNTAQTGLGVNTLSSMNAWMPAGGSFALSDPFSGARFSYAPDGLNPWDDNARDDPYDDPADGSSKPSHRHWVKDDYNHRYPSGSGTNATYEGGFDKVTGGVDDDPRFGSVYATLSGGAMIPQADPANGKYDSGTVCGPMTKTGTQQCWQNAVVAGKLLANGTANPDATHLIPANYFRGFIVRNADTTRDGKGGPGNLMPMNYITNSSASTAASPNTIFLVMDITNKPGSTHNLFGIGANNEIRRVRTYYGAGGGGGITARIDPNQNPPDPAILVSGSPNKRWVQTRLGGLWAWANWRRSGNTPYVSTSGSGGQHELSMNNPTGDLSQSVRDWHQDITHAATEITAANGYFGMTALFTTKGYPYNANITADSNDAKQLVGAPFGKQFQDHGVVVADTRTVAQGQPTSGYSPEFASFPIPPFNGKVAIGGAQYPHPLVAPLTNIATEITSADNTAFVSGTSSDFTVTTSGFPLATSITQSGKPAAATFTFNSSDGTAVLHWTSPVAGTYPITFTATNGIGTPDTQSFTLTVTSPVVTLTSPTAGQTFNLGDQIELDATVTGATGVTVDFYNGSTSLGSDSTSPFQFFWTPTATGTYTLKAGVGSVFSSTVDITVVGVPIPTPPAQIQVKP